jgi:hypothetical protein
MIMVDVAHNHPVMRVFCFLVKSGVENRRYRIPLRSAVENTVYGDLSFSENIPIETGTKENQMLTAFILQMYMYCKLYFPFFLQNYFLYFLIIKISTCTLLHNSNTFGTIFKRINSFKKYNCVRHVDIKISWMMYLQNTALLRKDGGLHLP